MLAKGGHAPSAYRAPPAIDNVTTGTRTSGQYSMAKERRIAPDVVGVHSAGKAAIVSVRQVCELTRRRQASSGVAQFAAVGGIPSSSDPCS
jgi:hypothetical protein